MRRCNISEADLRNHRNKILMELEKEKIIISIYRNRMDGIEKMFLVNSRLNTKEGNIFYTVLYQVLYHVL